MAEHQAYTVSNTRDILVSYAGGSHGLHSGLRRGILEWCAESSDSECKVHDCTQKGVCVNNFAILATYARSVFCLQPDGDTPTRQGWFDALLSGCIPVFFSTCLRPVKANSNLYKQHPAAFEFGLWLGKLLAGYRYTRVVFYSDMRAKC